MSEAGEPKKRDQAIEALRIVAAFAIVAFHAQVGDYRWWHSGLVVFVFLAAMFAAQPRDEPRPVLLVLRRLMVPFVFWYGVYLAANFALGRPLLLDSNWVTAVLAGPSFHLWFLPFAAFGVGLALQFGKMDDGARRTLANVSAVVGAFMLAGSSRWFPLFWEFPSPLSQWAHASPALLLGIFAGCIFHGGIAAMLQAVFYFSVSLIAFWAGASSFGPAYAAAFAALGAVTILTRFWPPNWRVQPIADCMFGVYLTHIITLAIAARVVGRENWAQVVIAFALSLAGVYLARRFVPVTRHVLG